MTDASRIWVKICGNTSLGDAMLAAEAGADAVGFVFASSPRRVTIEQAGAITAHLPGEIEKIGVFVDASLEEICSAVRNSGLTGVQLHCETTPELPAQLRRELGSQLRVVRVVHFGPQAVESAKQLAADASIDAILVDSRTATLVGGTGRTFDWMEARDGVFGAGAIKLIAAGGLTPESVREAIAILRPWGVDVASGVEAVPGRKDPEKVRRFVAHARASGAR